MNSPEKKWSLRSTEMCALYHANCMFPIDAKIKLKGASFRKTISEPLEQYALFNIPGIIYAH